MSIQKKQVDALVKEILERTEGERFFEISSIDKRKGYQIIKIEVENIIPIFQDEINSIELLTSTKKNSQKLRLLEELHRTSYEDLAIFDIETRGLSSDGQIFLAGFYFPGKEKSISVQFVAKTLSKEKNLLRWVINHFKKFKVITYNGSVFDLPFVKKRCELHKLDFVNPSFHLDILPLARSIWKETYASRKLTILEHNLMEIYREFDVPSNLLPTIIKLYEKTGDEKYLKIVSRHNLYDLLTTFKLIFEIRKNLMLTN
jgi:uncharacterized protein YprB with RNaseH-like and TPR domain